MSSSTTVLLYELGGLALIIPSKTGIVYRTQSGGHSCFQTEAEGYIVPIAGERQGIVERLHSHFAGPKWGGWCSQGIDDQTADEIEQLLDEVSRRDQITIDRDKLEDSWESWIHVKIHGQLLSLIENSNPTSAILTWPNSD